MDAVTYKFIYLTGAKTQKNTVRSLANSEMAILGDLMVGTKPPLIFELVADKNKDAFV